MAIFNKSNKEIEEIKKEYNSLLTFVNLDNVDESITDDEDMNSVVYNVVEIANFRGDHDSNGLLISKEGHVLTAMYCTPKLHERQIIYKGKAHAVEKHCAHIRQSDIAIIKTAIRTIKDPEFKIYDTKNLHKEEVFLLTHRPDKKIITGEISAFDVCGRMNSFNSDGKLIGVYSYKNFFMIRIESRAGDSGGVITSKDFKVMGIQSGGVEKYLFEGKSTIKYGLAIKYGVASKILDAVILAKNYRNMLYEKYLK